MGRGDLTKFGKKFFELGIIASIWETLHINVEALLLSSLPLVASLMRQNLDLLAFDFKGTIGSDGLLSRLGSLELDITKTSALVVLVELKLA